MPCRVQSWAGENGDRSDKALHPSQVAGSHPIHPMGERSTSKLGRSIYVARCGRLVKAASRRGWVGG